MGYSYIHEVHTVYLSTYPLHLCLCDSLSSDRGWSNSESTVNSVEQYRYSASIMCFGPGKVFGPHLATLGPPPMSLRGVLLTCRWATSTTWESLIRNTAAKERIAHLRRISHFRTNRRRADGWSLFTHQWESRNFQRASQMGWRHWMTGGTVNVMRPWWPHRTAGNLCATAHEGGRGAPLSCVPPATCVGRSEWGVHHAPTCRHDVPLCAIVICEEGGEGKLSRSQRKKTRGRGLPERKWVVARFEAGGDSKEVEHLNSPPIMLSWLSSSRSSTSKMRNRGAFLSSWSPLPRVTCGPSGDDGPCVWQILNSWGASRWRRWQQSHRGAGAKWVIA
jgi:hypothetical protein